MPAKALPVTLVAESVSSELVNGAAIHTLHILEDSSGQFHIQGRADQFVYSLRLKRGRRRTFCNLATATELIRGMACPGFGCT